MTRLFNCQAIAKCFVSLAIAKLYLYCLLTQISFICFFIGAWYAILLGVGNFAVLTNVSKKGQNFGKGSECCLSLSSARGAASGPKRKKI